MIEAMIIFTQIVILSFFLSHFICPSCFQTHLMLCSVGSNLWPVLAQNFRYYEVHLPQPTWNQDTRSFVQGGSCLFLMSSKLACPKWNNRTVFSRVGDSEMRRITRTIWYILPSFKIMYYHLQRLHILIWLLLLSFSKTEAKSGK